MKSSWLLASTPSSGFNLNLCFLTSFLFFFLLLKNYTFILSWLRLSMLPIKSAECGSCWLLTHSVLSWFYYPVKTASNWQQWTNTIMWRMRMVVRSRSVVTVCVWVGNVSVLTPSFWFMKLYLSVRDSTHSPVGCL